MTVLPDDCFAHAGDLMRHDEVIALLLQRLTPLAKVERLKLEQAAGRVLAEPVIAPRPIPAFDNAAMDGYGFAHGSLNADAATQLPVTAVVAAGHPLDRAVQPGEAVRIFTGAEMPPGADTVVMQEMVTTGSQDGRDLVTIPAGIKHGANRRRAGEDVAAGAAIAAAGTVLRPQDMAAIASTGAGEVMCHALLKVALISSGDEIIRPGTDFRDGAVYDANTFLLRAFLARLPVIVTDYGILPDRAELVESALSEAAASHDLIITSGGSSVGDEDHMTNAVAKLGHLNMWRLAIKPGKPLAFGQIGDAVFLGLPGNPVAAAVTFMMYARLLLARLGGADWTPPLRIPLPSAFDLPSRKTGRREFLRGRRVLDESGRMTIDRYFRDGSGLISSLRESDGLIELPEDLAAIKKGDPIAFIPFSELGMG